jgi:hypothetical protein
MPDIVGQMPFGDVDYGPRAGVNYVIRIGVNDDADAAAADLWEYLQQNYQDPWQEYRRSTVSTTAEDESIKLVQVIVLTTWGDGHRSTW